MISKTITFHLVSRQVQITSIPPLTFASWTSLKYQVIEKSLLIDLLAILRRIWIERYFVTMCRIFEFSRALFVQMKSLMQFNGKFHGNRKCEIFIALSKMFLRFCIICLGSYLGFFQIFADFKEFLWDFITICEIFNFLREFGHLWKFFEVFYLKYFAI